LVLSHIDIDLFYIIITYRFFGEGKIHAYIKKEEGEGKMG
jgi:hypothetical protein